MTGPSSERTADALKVVEGLELLFRVSRFHNLPTDVAEQGLAALDRLVARNQQLQEALDAWVTAYDEAMASDEDTMLWLVAHKAAQSARAALASVRARTP